MRRCAAANCAAWKGSGLCVRRGGREGEEEGGEEKKCTTAGLHLCDAGIAVPQEKGTREDLLMRIILLKGDVDTTRRNRFLRNGGVENPDDTEVG
jgi:hypothetical protein